MLIAFSIFLFWLGPPLALFAAGLFWFAARRNHDATHPVPWTEFWMATLAWGAAGAAVWIGLVALLLLVTRAGNAGLWIVFIPWAFAAGEAVGLFRLRKVLHGRQA